MTLWHNELQLFIEMIKVNGLIWDEWNREHIVKHDVTVAEVEEACHAKLEISDSYRKRILVVGKTKKGRILAVVLSPEDREFHQYPKDIFYPITAFEKEVQK